MKEVKMIKHTVSFFLINFLLSTAPLYSKGEELFDYIWLENQSLALEIGEKLFNEPGDGCWTCHGTDGAGIKSPEAVSFMKSQSNSNLRDVTTWTSHKIVSNYKAVNDGEIGQRDIAISLIRLGATDWNANLVPVIKTIIDTDAVFFDDRMIGIHSKYLKKNSKAVVRKLKRNKIRFKSKDLMDIMATSVFLYIEKTMQTQN